MYSLVDKLTLEYDYIHNLVKGSFKLSLISVLWTMVQLIILRTRERETFLLMNLLFRGLAPAPISFKRSLSREFATRVRILLVLELVLPLPVPLLLSDDLDLPLPNPIPPPDVLEDASYTSWLM